MKVRSLMANIWEHTTDSTYIFFIYPPCSLWFSPTIFYQLVYHILICALIAFRLGGEGKKLIWNQNLITNITKFIKPSRFGCLIESNWNNRTKPHLLVYKNWLNIRPLIQLQTCNYDFNFKNRNYMVMVVLRSKPEHLPQVMSSCSPLPLIKY